MLFKIQKCLQNHPWKNQIHYFEELDSTNNYAKKLALQGAVAGSVIIAGRQSAGRGRLGRSFSSPENMGIYLSVILRPNCKPSEIMHLTCAAGVAAVRSIGADNIGIKWTNDLVIGKRKLGGILTELSIDPHTGNVAWAVIGIGINCCQKPEQFPAEIKDIACSLGIECQDVPSLAAKLIDALYQMDQELLTKKAEILDAFRDLCVTLGQEISILQGDRLRHGKALDIDADGGLIVQNDDGKIEIVASGEVSIRGMYGYL